jgi:hypothetical protein
MFRNPFKLNWKKSPAHLILLSNFTSPRTINDFSKHDVWKNALGETPSKAIKRFTDDGYLIIGNVSVSLDYKFKVTDLKKLLKTRELKVSGNKSVLIQRLIDADPVGIKKEISGVQVFVCSDIGKSFIEEYKESEKRKRLFAEEKTIAYLEKRKFKNASQTIALDEADQVFPRGIGIDWKYYDTKRDEKVLKYIFESLPKIIIGIKKEKLETLRIAASMMYL